MKLHIVNILLILFVCNSVVLGCGRGRRRGRSCPPRDRTRPTIKCPPNIEAVADPFQINTKVWWDERTISANDNRDGPITPVRSGKAPGKLFSGTTRITYTAKDKAGNYASCSFYIIVKILVCPTWGEIQDGWKICHVSSQMRRGSVCRFGCYGGHELVGPSKTTCLDSEQWDTATQPYCRKLQCSELLPSVGQYGVVDISCTDNNYYRSKCSYNCNDGYSILPGHSKVRVCNEYGNWRGRMPVCEDTSPPVFQDCPYVKVGYAERSKTSGRVWWNEPHATDNSGIVNTIRISGPGSGTELDVGEHTVTYMASDAANNTVICEFNVVVKQIKCHMIYPLPYTAVVCPTGRIFGSSCEFTCDNGTALNGPAHAQCDKTGEIVPYGRWTFMNNQPYCENINTCPALRAPDNGALACDTWLQGKFCQILCEDGYVVTNDQNTQGDEVAVQKNLLVCGDSGNWYLSANIPNCQEIDNERLLTLLKLKFEYYYYDGPCDEAREDIKNKFIEAFNKGTGQDCKPKCSISKVKIICGNKTGDSSRKRKSTDPTITFSVTVELSNDLSPTEKAITRNSIKNSVTKATENGDYNLEIDGFSAESPTSSVSHIEGECSTGSAYDRTTMQCVKCNVGYFHDIDGNTCSACARGFYQDEPKQSTCKQCSTGKTTKTTGAYSAAQCEDACQPGFYSATGTPPCSACDLGSYNENYGSVGCTECQGSQITLKSGSISGSQCKEFDITYTQLNESEELATGSLETQVVSLSQFILTLFVKCTQCDSLVTLAGSESTDLSISHSDKIVVGYKGQQYSTGESIAGSMMWKQITVKYSGTEIITYLDNTEVLREQVSSERRKRSTETPVNITVTIGGEGFIGSFSQLNMWSDVTLFTPVVTDTCFNTGQGDLISWKQFSDTEGSFIITKSKCDVDNNCDSTSCHNGGSCSDSIGGFSCACARGFTGSFCEINIDDCLDNACDNNATCIDGHDKYSCVCPAGFKGDLCETHFVDGGWTDYEISGECSVTCGSGTQQMSRVCENPIPINGGKQCEGDSTKTVPCETNVVCINECGKDPTTLENGNMSCVSENDETRVCRPACNDGYEFDSDLYINSSGIVCGPDTGYVWNINTEDNPESQIPSCQPKHLAPKLSINQTGVYNTLSTETSDVEDSIKSTVSDKLKTAGCVANGKCELKGVHISSSDDQSEERKRRETSFVSFTIELTCDNTIGIDNCYDLLAEIVTIFNTLVENLAFTIQYGGVDYDVGVNSTYLDGLAECEPGYASVWQYCVSCGKGTYATNDYCESCPRGYYQDEEAQSSCKKCPDGWTTAGLMSRDSIHCNVEKPEEDSTINWILYIIIIVVVGTFSIILAVVAIVYRLKKRGSGVQPNGHNNIGDENSNERFQMSNVTPFYVQNPMYITGHDNADTNANKRFRPTTFEEELKASVEERHQYMDGCHGAYNNPIYTEASADPVAYTDASGAYIILETNLDKPPLSPPPIYKKNPKNAWE